MRKASAQCRRAQFRPIVASAAAGFFVFSVAGALAGEAMRLDGLERIYFEHMGAPGQPLRAPDNVSALLPEAGARLGEFPAAQADSDAEGDWEPEVVARDIELVLPNRAGQLWIRELTAGGESRIRESWWALYDGGRRSDVWFFDMRKALREGKALANYTIEGVTSATPRGFVLRLDGSMFRPGGAWWIVGKELTFEVDSRALRSRRLRNAYGFFQGYDTGEEVGDFTVSTEREVEGHFEIRELSPVTEAAKAACGSVDPENEEEAADWAARERIARCLTDRPEATQSRREFAEASFVERGPAAIDP